jgi:hypothetical protein
MFDINDDKKGSVRVHPDKAGDDYIEEDQEDYVEKQHELDSDENQTLHSRLMTYYRSELDRQYDNRIQQSIDADFYDHIQWNEQDAAALRERGQAPLVYNVISQSVNWVIGSEKRGRVDYKILPRTEEDHKPALRKTELLKYLSDVNRTPFNRSRAFEDAAKVGIGWLEDGLQDSDDTEPVYSRYESWRNMLWDSTCTELDLSDARYVIRTKWLDKDIASALFPDRVDLIDNSAVTGMQLGYSLTEGDEVMDSVEIEYNTRATGHAYDNYGRDRVRMIEVWFRKPERVQKIIDGQFRGEEYDPERHDGLIDHTSISERMQMTMHVAVMTPEGLCYLGKSPYAHNRFPFTPIWGYRRDRDGMPYGLIRGMRDIQEDINKRASKALYILSTNKVLMEEGAVDDIEEFREEVSRPDGILTVRAGKKVQLNVDRDLAPAHLEMMTRSIQMIQTISGVTDEQMGRTTNAVSGAAIEARQSQGALSTSKLFDNLRFAHQIQGELQLSLVEQFFTEEKKIRITNERGSPEFQHINDGLPENDITRSKADFIISDSDWRASMRQAQSEQLMEMLTRMPPEVAIVMLDLVVDNMDLPNRDEIVKRIRAINGQRDPDATELTEEEIAQMQAQQQQQQMQQAMLEAELRKKMAEAGKTEAEAARLAADLVKRNVESLNTSLQAAREAILSPGAAKMADQLMREAGFTSATEQQAKAESVAIQEQQMAEQQAMEQQAMQEQAAMQEQQGADQGGIMQSEQPMQ